MILNIQDTDEPSFLRHWAERVYDSVQLRQIATIEEAMVNYAMTAWRPMSIPPPTDILLLCTTGDGVVLMMQTQLGEWRDSHGLPRKLPRAWMPCPPPARDGRP